MFLDALGGNIGSTAVDLVLAHLGLQVCIIISSKSNIYFYQSGQCAIFGKVTESAACLPNSSTLLNIPFWRLYFTSIKMCYVYIVNR